MAIAEIHAPDLVAAAPVVADHPIARPFMKCAGGKRQLLPELSARVPEKFGAYYEPTVGGAALFFHLWSTGRLQEKRVVLGDSSPLLCELYTTIRDGVASVAALLKAHDRVHGKDHYLEVRDRLGRGNLAERAADLLYLNRTCYNGLMRFSKRGRFNTPMGRYVNPRICDEAGLLRASEALQDVEIVEGDFTATCKGILPGDFVYFDPPYLPLSKTSDFTSYAKEGFTIDDHKRLHKLALQLKAQGTRVLISNSSSPAIRELYAEGFTVEEVLAKRSINSKVAGRVKLTELLIH